MTRRTRTRAVVRVGDVPQELLERGRQMAGVGRDVWRAGLGALAMVGEEGTHLFDRLVASGEELEERGKKEVGARRKELSNALDDQLVDPVFSALKRFGVAGRAELDDIAARVEQLTGKVDRMLAHLTGEPVSGGHGPSPRVFRVVAEPAGWAVSGDGGDGSVHATKDEALEAARERARKHAPSRVEVFRKDGTLQDTHAF
ncbi:MAG TPA: phasin family protein [Longimicrobium sp.]|nr:phasin family protein [Longimicrobium sp.]